MISGDSTASHIGTAKNIEKARERRTFEVMPGSAATGIPEELQEHAQTIHPRMGYDMSDSLFMQQQEAAGRDKESKRAMEERTALEAFRAAALQKPFDPSAAGSNRASGDARATSVGGGSRGAGGDSKQKQPPPPLAGIKLRKKASRSGVSPSSAPPGAPETACGGKQAGDGEASGAGASPSAGEKRSAERAGGEEGKGEGSAKKKERGSGGGGGGGGSKKTKKKKSSKKTKSGKNGNGARESGDGGGADVAVAAAGLGLGLVAYSSGEDDAEEH